MQIKENNQQINVFSFPIDEDIYIYKKSGELGPQIYLSTARRSVSDSQEFIKIIKPEQLINTESDESVTTISFSYYEKEKEWIKLLGKNRFTALGKQLRDFLIKTAGSVSFGIPLKTKKINRYLDEV